MSLRMNQIQNQLARAIFLALYLALFVILATLLVQTVEAKVVDYGSTVEQVRIKYGGDTIFRFSKAVQTVTGASRLRIRPANDADPSYTVLAVTPRFTNGIHEVAFFLTDGSVVRTKILVSPNDPAADGLYDFKARDALDSVSSENAPTISEVELLKAMVRDDVVSGFKVSRVTDQMSTKQSATTVELIRIYRGSPFNGYVFRVTNTSWRKNVDVDPRHITAGDPNLAILSQSDDAVIYPKGKGNHQTLVRVVTKNTASSRDLILAMEAEEPQANSKKGE
ncbi:MAG: type-F conjugative transfer system secretin TraK [Bdellovibrionales bacterium]|nr:type-F conjugative transfer system secretin TraK [Bdellovibrionales bacterium]